MTLRRALALALLLPPAPLVAQYQPIGVSDADALAEQVRRLGANPLDLNALLTAGELSVRMDDLSAAGAFFARAEKIDPQSARAKAGEGAILVRSERPAEALRLFARAEQLGLPPARFAADRGLAYDLLGDPGRAQRDYKLALAARDEPETRRRYALSLGIAGRQAQAQEQLTPLLRQNDRAAWRARAFVLAMNGDAAEALRIAQTMMPPGAATSLSGFFAELPRLPAVDRAFAVHFGEVRASPQRLADARLAPRDAPLALEPLPVQVAAAAPAPIRKKRESRKERREREQREQLAALTPVPVPAPVAVALPAPPAYRAPAYVQSTSTDRPLTPGEQASLAAAGLRSLPSRPSSTYPRALTPAQQANLAAATTLRPPSLRPAAPPVLAAAPAPRTGIGLVTAPTLRREPVASTPAPTLAPQPTVRPPLPSATAPSLAAAAPAPASGLSILPTASVPLATTPAPTVTPPVQVAATDTTSPAPLSPAELATGGQATLASVAPGTAAAPAAIAPATSTPPAPLVTPIVAPPPTRVPVAVARVPARRPGRGDSILEKIVAGLTIPASELEVSGPVRPTPGTAKPLTARERRAAALHAEAKPADAKQVDPKKAASARKALADKKKAAAEKALADKAAAEAKRIERTQPSRIWVQVAGGANEAGLPLAWKTMKGKAPGLLGSRQAYTAANKASNRVLTGPFKTDAEARAYVNQLAKKGVGAFAFTSSAGQKVTKLDTK